MHSTSPGEYSREPEAEGELQGQRSVVLWDSWHRKVEAIKVFSLCCGQGSRTDPAVFMLNDFTRLAGNALITTQLLVVYSTGLVNEQQRALLCNGSRFLLHISSTFALPWRAKERREHPNK